MLKIGIDFDPASSALHLGVSAGLRHQICSAEVQAGSAAMMTVIHRLGGAGQHLDPVDRCVVHRFDRNGLLLVGLGLLGEKQSSQEWDYCKRKKAFTHKPHPRGQNPASRLDDGCTAMVCLGCVRLKG